VTELLAQIAKRSFTAARADIEEAFDRGHADQSQRACLLTTYL
jgi:hypothetical protein